MPRKQYWALRQDVSWERTNTKSEFPTAEIRRRWPDLAENVVTLTALAPSDVDRPMHERWAYKHEVVGLGSARRASAKLFERLQEEAKLEVKRREALKIDPENIVIGAIANGERHHESIKTDFLEELKTHGLKYLLTKTWGPNVPRYINMEEKRERWQKVAKLVKDKIRETHYDALVAVLAEVRDVSVPSVRSLLIATHYTIQEHFAALVDIDARNEWIHDAELTLREADKIRAAHRLEEEIKLYLRTNPETNP